MPKYLEHVRALKKEAEHRFAIVGHDELGDGVLMRDVGRMLPMTLYITMEICVGNTDPNDRKTLGHYDFFYRAYLLLHNGACAERKDHVVVQREIYDYIDQNDAGHAYAVFTGIFLQAMCTLMYTCGAVIGGMVEQRPQEFFAHSLAQNILNNAPADMLKQTAQYLQNEGVYPRTSATAFFSSQLVGVQEMIAEDQEQILNTLQRLRESEQSSEAAKEAPLEFAPPSAQATEQETTLSIDDIVDEGEEMPPVPPPPGEHISVDARFTKDGAMVLRPQLGDAPEELREGYAEYPSDSVGGDVVRLSHATGGRARVRSEANPIGHVSEGTVFRGKPGALDEHCADSTNYGKWVIAKDEALRKQAIAEAERKALGAEELQ